MCNKTFPFPVNVLHLGIKQSMEIDGLRLPASSVFPNVVPSGFTLGEIFDPSLSLEDEPFKIYRCGVPVFSEILMAQNNGADTEKWWRFSLPKGVEPYWTGPIWFSIEGEPPPENFQLLNELEAAPFLMLYRENMDTVQFHSDIAPEGIGLMRIFHKNVRVNFDRQRDVMYTAYREITKEKPAYEIVTERIV